MFNLSLVLAVGKVLIEETCPDNVENMEAYRILIVWGKMYKMAQQALTL